jgi:aryl-phospho-beta-D-glucosidase BglC (GH1 family)
VRFRFSTLVLVLAVVPLVATAPGARAATCVAQQEIDLWNKGVAVLRGANVYQGRNIDNPGVFGDGPFTQSDFDELAAAGANYVHVSHAGIFAEDAPYAIDQAAVENLDDIIDMAAAAGLYASIGFRSGPGRNDLSIIDATDPRAKHALWTSQAAQDAWVGMVKFAAERYRNDPTVVGLSVIVEPTAYSQHGFIGPEEFYAQFGGTLEDVNVLYARATAAIREVDANTPILLEPEGHGNISWLPFLRITGDPRTVYTVHDYTPFEFVHDGTGKYPSRRFNKRKQRKLLGAVEAFGQANGVPVAVTEFGARDIDPTAWKYVRHRIATLDEIGNWAVWNWQPAGFIDPFSVHNPSRIHDVVTAAWASNCTRA